MNFLRFIFMTLLLAGCASTKHDARGVVSPSETPQEVESAMGTVVGAVTGTKASEEDLHKLEDQIRHDKEAQSAVESITQGMTDPSAMGKYCPVDGERYSAKFEKCPQHDVLLKNIEE